MRRKPGWGRRLISTGNDSSAYLPFRLFRESVSRWISLSTWLILSVVWRSWTLSERLVLFPPWYASTPVIEQEGVWADGVQSPSLEFRKSNTLGRFEVEVCFLFIFRLRGAGSFSAIAAWVLRCVNSAHWSSKRPFGSTTACTGSTRPESVFPKPAQICASLKVNSTTMDTTKIKRLTISWTMNVRSNQKIKVCHDWASSRSGKMNFLQQLIMVQ